MTKIDISAPISISPERAGDLASPGNGDVGGNNGKTVDASGPAVTWPTPLTPKKATGSAHVPGSKK